MHPTRAIRHSRPAEAAGGLPQFCGAPTLFAVMVVAELVAIVVVLAPRSGVPDGLARLGVVSLYVQWLALLNVVVLCSLRAPLQRLAPLAGVAIAWAASILVSVLGSAVIARMDQALGLGLSVDVGETPRFVVANAIIAALIAAALLRYLYVLEQWRGRVQAASKAEVEALQARIRPHFLFNSMNTIASLIRSRPAEAERTVEDLADLFRAALGSEDGHGTLGAELELIERYLHIERLRLGERLATAIEVGADVPRGFALPRLLLQPLVENAVYHGIQPRADGGTVSIQVARVGQGLAITIANPLPPDAAPPRNGIALANVRARVHYHFGPRAGLEVEAAGGRFVVRLRLAGAMLQ
ncbi:MAG: sensor histidine kinase [Xanthomonadales bacterium]|nr:sensor histidine kinase [Xanthomonadales bacterium]